jgi:hypothetical protein
MPTPLTDALQSWGKCDGCKEIIWCTPSVWDQACGCVCGGFHLKNTEVIGIPDPLFTAEDMELILEAE